MNEKKLSWDDLRTVLAVAQAGSLSGATRILEVSHATVFRRLDTIERRLGVRLFDRSRAGYVPTPAGEDVAAAAERIDAEVVEVQRRVAGQDLRPSGTVRVTTTDALLMELLSPIFAQFSVAYPEISLEIAVSNQLFNLSKREADVAIRPSTRPPENLLGRKIGTIAQAVYGASGNATALDGPTDAALLPWVGPDERLGYDVLDSWMNARRVSAQCRYRVDSVLGMRAAIREGMGVGVLPCYLADGDRSLTRLGHTIPELATDLWLLSHPDLRQVARIRAFSDFISASVAQARARLTGSTADS